MNYFDDQNVNLNALKAKAFNLRWAEVEEGVIPLTAADPDFPSPPSVSKALREYIDDGYFSYTPKTGLPAFKDSFSNYIKKKGEQINSENILVTDSAARAMFIIAKAFLKPGDEMLVFDPCDFLFREACISSGAIPVPCPIPLDTAKRKMDLSSIEDHITKRTKMIGLCNPHNPYGLTCTKEELDTIMTICEKHDLLIMNDEIWSDIIYSDAAFNSIYCLGNERCKRVLSLFGFSKSFGLAGLRIGALYTSDHEKYDKLVQASDVLTTAGGASSLSQIAAIAAMNDSEEWSKAFLAHLERNRDHAVSFIRKNIPECKVYLPEATYLLYIDISSLNMKADAFTDFLLKEEKLAIVPGGHTFFGDHSEGHVRISFATSGEILKEGLTRFKKGFYACKQ